MAIIGWKQIVSILILNVFVLWLTYGFFVSSNPLTMSSSHMLEGCMLVVDFPENLYYGQEIRILGRLSCVDLIHKELAAQAILICGDITTLTVNTTKIKDDGSFILKLNPSFQKPFTGKIQCSLTVQVISKTVSTDLMVKKTLIMLIKD